MPPSPKATPLVSLSTQLARQRSSRRAMPRSISCCQSRSCSRATRSAPYELGCETSYRRVCENASPRS
eukprot:6930699-Prymnesium_polylepis.1